MVSDLAISEVEAMRRRGLVPSVADIVRLNALACRIQYGAHAAEYYALPRVAFLGDLQLTQPTLAHELWLDRVADIVDMIDNASYFACRLYAASYPAAALADPTDRKAVKRAVEDNLARFGAWTMDAVSLALAYVEKGGEDTDGETPPPRPDNGKTVPLPPNASIALAVIHDGVACRLGISLADMKGMTRGQLLAVTHAAIGIDRDANKQAMSMRRVDFFRAVDEITARLEAEKKGKGAD